ncbi:hypothetical protein [Streptodolium elevatio]|uniref:Uncharacterized protein n=1 Tax=Streptodolium elevatio TaxID=3157996 RepID=A0ABV3D999_9ACTN
MFDSPASRLSPQEPYATAKPADPRPIAFAVSGLRDMAVAASPDGAHFLDDDDAPRAHPVGVVATAWPVHPFAVPAPSGNPVIIRAVAATRQQQPSKGSQCVPYRSIASVHPTCSA